MSKSLALPGDQQHTTRSCTRRGDALVVAGRRIIASFVEEICRNMGQSRPRILDVGCGTGANLELLSRFGRAEGVDVSEEALAFCRARGLENVRHGAAEKLPYEDGSFDLVTALDVVEHRLMTWPAREMRECCARMDAPCVRSGVHVSVGRAG